LQRKFDNASTFIAPLKRYSATSVSWYPMTYYIENDFVHKSTINILWIITEIPRHLMNLLSEQ
jgi:hypothetical protein